MGMLFRVRLAYRTLLNKGGLEYAVIYMSLIVSIFYVGCWSLLGLVVPYSLTSVPFLVWAFIWVIFAVSTVYFICIWKHGYTHADKLVASMPEVQKRREEVKNGLLLVIISILPQIVALTIMLLK
ncbi:hypothetical protein [Vibrio diabolicus]